MFQSHSAWRMAGGILAGVVALLAGTALLQLLAALAYFLMGQTKRPPAPQIIELIFAWLLLQTGIVFGACLLAFFLSRRSGLALAALAAIGALLTATLLISQWLEVWPPT